MSRFDKYQVLLNKNELLVCLRIMNKYSQSSEQSLFCVLPMSVYALLQDTLERQFNIKKVIFDRYEKIDHQSFYLGQHQFDVNDFNYDTFDVSLQYELNQSIFNIDFTQQQDQNNLHLTKILFYINNRQLLTHEFINFILK